MDTLWAPWRMSYMKKLSDPPRNGVCVFCQKNAEDNDAENLVLYKGKKSFVVMNLYPYTNGHLLIIPCNHTADFETLDQECWIEVWHLLALCKKVLTECLHPDGFNIGMNLGRSAGAGISDHLHWHIVPRWNGDNNFMPVLGGVRIMSQSLEDCYAMLLPYFKKYKPQ
ncbi:MAG: HIT domain-containing protein [Chitinivibrionales bacterium]|nr:HIT domain-containing protein [Chitinivibrionales bacterium]